MFIIGNLRGQPRPKVFPIGNDDKEFNGKISGCKNVANTIKAQYWKGNTTGSYVAEFELISQKTRRLGQKNGNQYVVENNQPKRHPLKFLQRNQKNIKGDYSFTVDGANTGGIKQGMSIRRLTPIECERLQGFPDNWTKYGTDGELISDTQRYKMCGNAVTVNVITYLGQKLYNNAF